MSATRIEPDPHFIQLKDVVKAEEAERERLLREA